MHKSIFPILSGVFGSLAGYAGNFYKSIILKTLKGKVAFSNDQWIICILAFIAMLYLNKYMFQFLFKSFETNGSSLTVLLNFITNNALNVYSISKYINLGH